MKDNTAIKKKSVRPADPHIIEKQADIAPTGEAAEETKGLSITPVADGLVFKFSTHPKNPKQFVLFNSRNEVVAVTENAAYADLICQAVRMLFAAVAQQHADKQPLTDEQLAKNNAAYKQKTATEIGTGEGTGATTCAEVEGK